MHKSNHLSKPSTSPPSLINHLLLENPKTESKVTFNREHTQTHRSTNYHAQTPDFKPKLKNSDPNNPKGNPISKPT